MAATPTRPLTTLRALLGLLLLAGALVGVAPAVADDDKGNGDKVGGEAKDDEANENAQTCDAAAYLKPDAMDAASGDVTIPGVARFVWGGTTLTVTRDAAFDDATEDLQVCVKSGAKSDEVPGDKRTYETLVFTGNPPQDSVTIGQGISHIGYRVVDPDGPTSVTAGHEVTAATCDAAQTLSVQLTTGITYKLGDTTLTAANTPVTGPTQKQDLSVVAADGHTISNVSSYPVEITLSGKTTPCPGGKKKATPVAPTVNLSAGCGLQGSLVIPTTAGVTYLWNGTAKTGTLPGPLVGTVTAQPADDTYELTGPAFSVPVDIPAAPTPCGGGPTEVAALPALSDPGRCGEQGYVTLQPVTGVVYRLDGKVVEGRLQGPFSGLLTAEATPGYVLRAPFEQRLTVPPQPVTCDSGTATTSAVAPRVAQSAGCGRQGTLALTPVDGVRYLLGGTVVSGDLTGPVDGLLTAEAEPGFVLGAPLSQWVSIPAGVECPEVLPTVIAAPAPSAKTPRILPFVDAPPVPRVLPFTGSSTVARAGTSGLLIALGACLAVAGRRRRPAAGS